MKVRKRNIPPGAGSEGYGAVGRPTDPRGRRAPWEQGHGKPKFPRAFLARRDVGAGAHMSENLGAGARMSDRLAILFVSQVPPSPPGFGAQVRINGLMTALAQRHDVSVACSAAPEEVEASARALGEYCRDVEIAIDRASGSTVRRRVLQLRSLASTRGASSGTSSAPPSSSAASGRSSGAAASTSSSWRARSSRTSASGRRLRARRRRAWCSTSTTSSST